MPLIFKTCQTIAGIIRMSQFHESSNLILGCFFRPSKWRRGTTESRFQQHSVFRGQHREWAPGAGYRHQPWGRRPWQKETCPRIIHGGRFNVWIHDQWWQKLNDIWTDWFVNKTKNSSKNSVTWTVAVIWQVFVLLSTEENAVWMSGSIINDDRSSVTSEPIDL